jgi:hypothetical protein
MGAVLVKTRPSVLMGAVLAKTRPSVLMGAVLAKTRPSVLMGAVLAKTARPFQGDSRFDRGTARRESGSCAGLSKTEKQDRSLGEA